MLTITAEMKNYCNPGVIGDSSPDLTKRLFKSLANTREYKGGFSSKSIDWLFPAGSKIF